MTGQDRKRFRALVAFANTARDAQRYEAAASLYDEALRLAPDDAAIQVQCGHMFKEAGRLEEAERHYLAAERLVPGDADLALQLGHFFKRAQRWTAAETSYQRALNLQPGWTTALGELEAISEDRVRAVAVAPDDPELFSFQFAGRPDAFGGRTPAELEELVPALAPKRHEDLLVAHGQSIGFRRLGHREPTFWGNKQVLRGVEAVRGVCISRKPIVAAEILLNGHRIHAGPIRGGYDLPLESDFQVKKYVFNYWLDFTRFARGAHRIDVRCIDCDDGVRSHGEDIVIADPLSEADYPASDFLLTLEPSDRRSIDDQVRGRPSMVRPARRALFPDGVHNVLVTRTDQLGDMVASIAAIQRLREIVPQARIVGLLNYANGELARTLDLFDEIIVINFPDDPIERRRLMTLDAQEELRDRLAPFEFDIAIDLAQAGVSRELLRLAGAKFTYGTGGEDWPWLSADYQSHSRDRFNRHDFTPHSSKVLGLIETLGSLLKTSAPILRRADISRDTIADYGIAANERFAVIHAGARIGFSRWPHYGKLARMLLKASDIKLVIITEDPEFRATVPSELLDDPRVIFLDRRLPFDHFDAFLSFATVLVGNDSGPKHLASLRGTNVVTIFSARINWQEWGQENVGVIISRKVPCAGCALLHDAEECGRDFMCVTDIKVGEVFDAMMAYIDPVPGAAS